MTQEELSQMYDLVDKYIKEMPIWSKSGIEIIHKGGGQFQFSKEGFAIGVTYNHLNFVGLRTIYDIIQTLEA